MIAEQTVRDIPFQKSGDAFLSNQSILELMTRVAGYHGSLVENRGGSPDQCGSAWVVQAWKLKVSSRPVSGTPVTVRTWARAFTRVQAFRDFELLDPGGERFAAATSVWATIDRSTRSLLRLDPQRMESYGPEPERFSLPGFRFSRILPDAAQPSGVLLTVGDNLIDENAHVHNSAYPELILPAFPGEINPEFFHETEIQYFREILPGQQILIERTEKSGSHCVWIRDAGGTAVHAVIILN